MQKMTIEVAEDVYNKVTKSLHYGQLSAITRKFMENLASLQDADNNDLIFAWLYNDKPLTINEEKHKDD